MIQNLFASQIWKSSLNIQQDIRNKFLISIEKNYKKYENYLHPTWPCKVHTTIDENNEVDYSFIISYFKEEYEKFAKEINLKYHNYNIHRIWYNLYLKGYNQELHDHIKGDILYSAVYFLKLHREHPSITFYNYTNYDAYYASKENIRNLYIEDNINHSITRNHFTLDVKENDFIIFPAYLPHGVFIQKTDEPRITISMNFTLENTYGSTY